MGPKVSIIIPAHNEEGNLRKCVSSVMKTCKKLDYEIVLVDDVSRDKTGGIVDDLAKRYRRVKSVHRKMPNGFGRAIKTGLEKSKGDILIPFMADMSDDPKTILKMVKGIDSGYDIAVGSRFIKGGKTVDYPKAKYLAHRIYNKLVALVFMKDIKDFSNAFKAYRRGVLDGVDIESDGFEITSEMILKPIIMKNAKVIEVPTTWKNRKTGKAKFSGLYKQGWCYGKVLLKALKMKVSH